MDVLITESSRHGDSTYFTASCGNKSAFVCIRPPSCAGFKIQVICQNASHKAFRQSGRHFHSVPEALEAYKSPEIRAIIQAAEAQHNQPQEVNATTT